MARQIGGGFLLVSIGGSWAYGFPLFSTSAMTQGYLGTAYEKRYQRWEFNGAHHQRVNLMVSYRFANRAVAGLSVPYMTIHKGVVDRSGFSNAGLVLKYRFEERSAFSRGNPTKGKG